MVHQVLSRAIVGVGRARHQDDRQVLGIGAADRIDGGETADTEGDHSGGRAARASVTLRAITTIQLVAAIDLLQILVRQKLVEQDQVEIARDGKMMLQPDLRN